MEGLPARAALLHSCPPQDCRKTRAWSDRLSQREKPQVAGCALVCLALSSPKRSVPWQSFPKSISTCCSERRRCESGYAHARRNAAGDAGLVRLRGWSRPGEHREGASQSAQLEERRARRACDRRSGQSVPLRPDPRPRPARHGRRGGCAHRFARKEVPREGQVSECRARRSPPAMRDRADIGIRDGVNASGYSGLIFPSTITCFHFSYSERVKAAACSGVVPRGAIPILAKADFSSGCCSTLLISPLSLASTAGGSPAGAKMPIQRSTSKPGSADSATVGTSG